MVASGGELSFLTFAPMNSDIVMQDVDATELTERLVYNPIDLRWIGHRQQPLRVRHCGEKGERDVVLEYFDLCRRFWSMNMNDGKLDQWSQDVKAGKMPSFGANLEY